jgi:hypothetical protein
LSSFILITNKFYLAKNHITIKKVHIMLKKTVLVAANAILLAGQVQAADVTKPTQNDTVNQLTTAELLSDSDLIFIKGVEMEEETTVVGRRKGCKVTG